MTKSRLVKFIMLIFLILIGITANWNDSISIDEVTALSADEKIVYTYADLNDALSKDNGIRTVYLGADINVNVTGISIHSSKTSVEIVGLNPENPDQTEPFTLTDFSSATYTDTITVENGGVKNVYVRDLNIVGKNYYGPISVLDSAITSGLTLTFERVNYVGPTMVYHRTGKAQVIDCDIQITGRNGGSPQQEFSEVKHLQFKGDNEITIETNATSIFWHPVGGSFVIEDDSSLKLTSPNTSPVYGVYYADGGAYKIPITVGKKSTYDITISTVVAPIGNVMISALTLKEEANFRLKTTKQSDGDVLIVQGDLSLAKDADFRINGYGSNNYSLLTQRTGDIKVDQGGIFHLTAMNPYPNLLNLYGRSFICDNPGSVLLSNPANRAIQSTTTAGKLSINAEQVNIWNTFVSDWFSNPPLYKWKKADGQNISLAGNIAIGPSGNIGTISSNYESGDMPGEAPSPSNFNMTSAKILSFGRQFVTTDAVSTNSEYITGRTKPGSSVKVTVTTGGMDYILPYVTANEMGEFEVPNSLPLSAEDVVTVQSLYYYLSNIEAFEPQPLGTVEISIPETMTFFTKPIGEHDVYTSRAQHDWRVAVTDTRGAGSRWNVYLRQTEPLRAAGKPESVLEDALVFKDEDGNVTTLSNDSLLIREHENYAQSEEVYITWPDDEGILFRCPQTLLFSNIPYSSTLQWQLVDAP